MSRSSYAVWRARLRPGRWPDAPQEEQACAVVVSAYRGLKDDVVDVGLDLPVYVEVDEEALEARRRSRLEATTTLCITPEVSEVVSDEPPTPPPRTSISEATGEPIQCATRAQIGLPEADDSRLDTVTPLSDVEPPTPPPARDRAAERWRDGLNNKEASSSSSSRLSAPSWSRPDLVLPPHERLSVSPTPTRLGAVILEEDEEEGGEYGDVVDDDALSNAIYSDVIEDEDLYVSVPIEWDGSYASSNSDVWSSASGHRGRRERYDDDDGGSPEPEVAVSRPPRQPAQVIVIRASSNCVPATDSEPSCGGSPSRPPDDLPAERPECCRHSDRLRGCHDCNATLKALFVPVQLSSV
ncbi:uncharacterized protein LOC113216654 isoform X2 [Frankliniella occidentalis]|uniref:Uncharacterized protein LOC113216654 isoform X2 n=1 Tax=Frankliniella occidentalis TaxID=133901 RepID=A0A6J1TFE9_FRAOC|nr:uncharacterized protein LOC113216654 isoform X2 [Frankliniella occidentalis]